MSTEYCSLRYSVFSCAIRSGQAALQEMVVVEAGDFGCSWAMELAGLGRYHLDVLLAKVQHRSQGIQCCYVACRFSVAQREDQLCWPRSGVGCEPVILGALLQNSQLLLCDSYASGPG